MARQVVSVKKAFHAGGLGPIPSVEEIDAELARRSLAEFCRQAWHVLESTTPLDWNWHLDAVCDHVQALFEDWIAVAKANLAGVEPPEQRLKNVAIQVPPGSGKSRVVSVLAPAWMWVRWPQWRGIFISGNPRVCLRDADYSRIVIESEWYQKTFRPNWTLARDQNAKSLFRNTEGGVRASFSTGMRITGDRGDCIVIDDPNDASEVSSETYRDNIKNWWDTAAANRVSSLSYSTRLLIMQRLHQDDLTGHATKGKQWEHLTIRQEFEVQDKEKISVIGWQDPRTTEGELMFPKRFPADVLRQEKERLGSAGYAGQHQQRPSPAGGGLFKSTWFRYYTLDSGRYLLHKPDGSWSSVALDDCRRFCVLDVAATEVRPGSDPDWSVLQCWDVTPKNELILVNQWRDRVQLPDVATIVTMKVRQWNSPLLLCEKNGVGIGVFQEIQRNGIAVQGIAQNRDKITRSQTAQIRMEAGAIFFPKGNESFVPDLESELERFPFGSHDDQVDDVSLAAQHVHSGLFDMSFFDGGEVSVSFD